MSGTTDANARHPRLRRWVAEGYTLFLAAVSLWPRPPHLPGEWEIPHADKLAHALLYGAYAWLLLWTTRRGRSFGFTAAVVVYATAFGGLMEVLQTSISGPYRSGTLGDAVANAVGALAGAAVFACRKPAHPSAQRT